MHNFKELKIWKKSMDLSSEIIQLTSSFPEAHKFGLVNQINRSVVSIPSNIAEGTSRNSNKEFNRFIQIALGSAFELETQIIIAKQIHCLEETEANVVLANIVEIQKMIKGFSKTLL